MEHKKKTPSKTAAIIKRILLVLLILIVLSAVGVYCIFNFYIKPKYSKQILTAVDAILQDEELMNEINSALEDEGVQAEINNVLESEEVQSELEAAANSILGESGLTLSEEQPPVQTLQKTDEVKNNTPDKASNDNPIQNSNQPSSQGADNSVTATESPSTVQQEASTPTPTKKPSKMELAKEKVSPKDYAAGLKLASKIDVGYLSGLAAGGITPEEKKAAKEHLKSRLSASEISQLIGLIGKYSYLLK